MIDIPTRGTIFGSLDQSTSLLERAKHTLVTNLESGEMRFKQQDLDRMKSYIKKIKPELRQIESAIREFSVIAK